MHESDAAIFLEAGQAGRVFLQQQRLNLNWAKAQPLDPSILRAVEGGATRHLQVAGAEPGPTPTPTLTPQPEPEPEPEPESELDPESEPLP